MWLSEDLSDGMLPTLSVTEKTIKEDGQNPLVFQRWLFLADKIELAPELLSIPLKNIQRWMASGRLGDPWALVEWKSLIVAAQNSEAQMTGLLHLLRDDGESSRQLKSCSPFPGVLTRDERDQFTCAWTH